MLDLLTLFQDTDKYRALFGANSVAQRLYNNPDFRLDSLTEKELSSLRLKSGKELKIVRNTIFARHNFNFDTIWLRNVFIRNFSDYTPETKHVELTATDKYNIKFILKLEERQVK